MSPPSPNTSVEISISERKSVGAAGQQREELYTRRASLSIAQSDFDVAVSSFMLRMPEANFVDATRFLVAQKGVLDQALSMY